MTDGDDAYDAAVARLEQAARFGINPSLEGMRRLMDALGCPERECRCVQVTGTNGKTSVTRMIGAILSAHGYRTGVYTSPHLVSYTERIEIDGEPVSRADLVAALTSVFDVADSLGGGFTEFELFTAAALTLFRRRRVEIACLEVGMGGRWDATSIVSPDVAVITGVSLDHTDRLGTTREEIAADKAHIIKKGSIPIVGPGCDGVEHVFLERACEMGHPRILRVSADGQGDVTWHIVRRPRTPGGTLTVDVFGTREYRVTLRAPAYQAPNVATAMFAAGAALFNVLDPACVASALKLMTFPGRFELVRRTPPLVIDGAHNPAAASVLAGAIAEAFPERRPFVVLAVLADKDIAGIANALVGVAAGFVITENGAARCATASGVAAAVRGLTNAPVVVEPDLASALHIATRDSRGAGVVATGSLYTVGAVKRLFAEGGDRSGGG